MRVLVVDDNWDQLRALASLLRTMGHQVEIATNGSVALWRATNFRPEVVFLDVTMPYMDGLQVARAIRAMPDCKLVKIVAVTGANTTMDELRSSGFDDLLTKPAALPAISAVLDPRAN